MLSAVRNPVIALRSIPAFNRAFRAVRGRNTGQKPLLHEKTARLKYTKTNYVYGYVVRTFAAAGRKRKDQSAKRKDFYLESLHFALCSFHFALPPAPRDPGYIPFQRNLGELILAPVIPGTNFVVLTRQTNGSMNQ